MCDYNGPLGPEVIYLFSVPTEDPVNIYILYIWSLVEQNVAVWHHTITMEETEDLERVQKVALKMILKENYTNYDDALDSVGLENLQSR